MSSNPDKTYKTMNIAEHKLDSLSLFQKQEAATNQGKTMYTIDNSYLCTKLRQLRNDTKLADVRFLLKDGSELLGHKAIVCQYSPVVAAQVTYLVDHMVMVNCAELDTEQDILPHILRYILDYMYGQTVNIPSADIQQVMRLAIKLDMNDFLLDCDSSLFQNKSSDQTKLKCKRLRSPKLNNDSATEVLGDTMNISSCDVNVKQEVGHDETIDSQQFYPSDDNTEPLDCYYPPPSSETGIQEGDDLGEPGCVVNVKQELVKEHEDSYIDDGLTYPISDNAYEEEAANTDSTYSTRSKKRKLTKNANKKRLPDNINMGPSSTLTNLHGDYKQEPADKKSANTKKNIRQTVCVLTEYCTEHRVTPLGDLTDPRDMDEFLQQFYVRVRKRDGDLYKKKSFQLLRWGIGRYLLEEKNIEITCDAFRPSNKIFKDMIDELVELGKGGTQHTPVIEDEDLQKLYKNLDLTTPKGLQYKVFVDIMVYLCHKSRENLRAMTKETFVTSVNSEGIRFVEQSSDSIYSFSNNQKSGVNRPTQSECRMYEIKGHPLCPVTSYENYIKKLNPSSTILWQYPILRTSEYQLQRDLDLQTMGDTVWYNGKPIGHNTLGNMMKIISEDTRLSKSYTNNSLRSTTLHTLIAQGFNMTVAVKDTQHQGAKPELNQFRHILPRPADM